MQFLQFRFDCKLIGAACNQICNKCMMQLYHLTDNGLRSLQGTKFLCVRLGAGSIMGPLFTLLCRAPAAPGFCYPVLLFYCAVLCCRMQPLHLVCGHC